MKKLLVLSTLVASASLATPAFAQLWDNGAQGNGTLITQLNGMTGAVAGAHRSAISTPGSSTFGSAAGGTFRLADNFTVTGPGWNVSSFQFYAYLTGATAPSVTGVTVRIWDGTPGAAGSNIVFGNTTTNLLTTSGWATGPGGLGIYRTTGTSTTDTTRRVQEINAAVNLTLSPGSYWVDWAYTGANFTPPLSAPTGLPNAGNAVQFNGTAWVAAVDNTTTTLTPPLDFPFQIFGSPVPEPGTYALMLAGGLAVVGLARRRRVTPHG